MRLTHQITAKLQQHDPRLSCRDRGNGVLQVVRRVSHSYRFHFDGKDYVHVYDRPDVVLDLTEDFKPGNPSIPHVLISPDWVLNKIQKMDSWTKLQDHVREMEWREDVEDAWKKQSLKNNIRAVASELCGDMAKATSDIVARAGYRRK